MVPHSLKVVSLSRYQSSKPGLNREKMPKPNYSGSGDYEINDDNANESGWVEKIKDIFIISRETWIRIIIYASGVLLLIGNGVYYLKYFKY